jgi:hypothetical protein
MRDNQKRVGLYVKLSILDMNMDHVLIALKLKEIVDIQLTASLTEICSF